MESFVTTVKSVFASAFVVEEDENEQPHIVFFAKLHDRVHLHDAVIPRGHQTIRMEQLIAARLSRGKIDTPEKEQFDKLPYTEDVACRLAIDPSIGVELKSFLVVFVKHENDERGDQGTLSVLLEKSPGEVPLWRSFKLHRVAIKAVDLAAIASNIAEHVTGSVGSPARRLFDRVSKLVRLPKNSVSREEFTARVQSYLSEARDATKWGRSEAAIAFDCLHRMLYDRLRGRTCGSVVDDERDAIHARDFARKCASYRIDGGLSVLHMAATYEDVVVIQVLLDEGHDPTFELHGTRPSHLANTEFVRDVLRAAETESGNRRGRTINSGVCAAVLPVAVQPAM